MLLRLVVIGTVAGLLTAGCSHSGPFRSGEPPHPVAGWQATTVGAVAEPFRTVVEPHVQTVAAGPGEPVGYSDHGDGAGKYLLDSGDRLRVFVYGQPNLSRLYNVDHDGKIVVPLIGAVRARGRTVYGVADAIRARLGSQYVRDPQVTVDIFQNRPFFILGEVRSAGQYPYVSGMTIQMAAAIAGGYSERANERKARITRRHDGATEVIEVPHDYVLQPGDTVYVYERFF